MLESNDQQMNKLGESLLKGELLKGDCEVRYRYKGHTYSNFFHKGQKVDNRVTSILNYLKGKK